MEGGSEGGKEKESSKRAVPNYPTPQVRGAAFAHTAPNTHAGA